MKRGLLATLVVVLVLWLGVGWYYSSQALSPGGPRDVTPQHLVIGGVEDGRIAIAVGDDPQGNARLDTLGLLYAGGYGRLTGDVEVGPCPGEAADEATCVSRDFTLVTGVEPTHATAVRIDEYAFAPGDPSAALGVEVLDLDIATEVGPAPAWWVPPVEGMPVAVLVHGRGGSRDEMLRIASVLQPQGYGILVPTYRGDGVAPDPVDGLGRFGDTEWLDVAMAMLHQTVPSGARFILVGYSQGGAIVGELLESADVAQRVDAVVLDSPLIGLDATMQLQARLAGIPNPLVRPVLSSAYLWSRLRGFDFGTGERVTALAEQPLPILLFHGPDDSFVPFGPSERLAQADPDGVTYVRVPDVDHVRFWNDDPIAYQDAVLTFLSTHLP